MIRRAHVPQEPGDEKLIAAAQALSGAAAALSAAVELPLFDPHTIWRVLDRLVPVAASLKQAAEALDRKVLKADQAGLLSFHTPRSWIARFQPAPANWRVIFGPLDLMWTRKEKPGA